MYGRFVTLIARSRKIPEDRVRTLADGRIYTAEQAKALGLVDEIVQGELRDGAVAFAERLAALHGPEIESVIFSCSAADERIWLANPDT